MEQPDIIIGNNLKRIREDKNLSYNQLADLTGVSKSMLRQIEIGASSPTINTLWKIANGLEIPFSLLINPPSPTISKQAFDAAQVIEGTAGYRLFPMLPFDTTRHFELYYSEIEPDVSLDADPHTGNAEEIVMVLQGRIDITVVDTVNEVHAGEMLRFDANYAHQYHNPLDEVAKGLFIISYRV